MSRQHKADLLRQGRIWNLALISRYCISELEPTLEVFLQRLRLLNAAIHVGAQGADVEQ